MSRLTSLLIAAFAGVLLTQAPARAQSMYEDGAPSRTISVPTNKSVAFRLSSNAAEVVVAQPDIAQIVANTDRSVYLRGMTMGSTNVLVYDKGHRLVEVIDVNVGFDAAAAQAEIIRALPNEKITATSFNGGILLSGEATNSMARARAQSIAERYAPKAVTSEIYVSGSEQVMLEVRILEANRLAMKDFGISLEASGGRYGFVTNGAVPANQPPGTLQSGLFGGGDPAGRLGIRTSVGGFSIDIALDALEEKGMLRTLARPNLAALSGEEASFLAGGEFPYEVSSGLGETSIEFKPFGVQLKFTPTVGANGTIKLKVAPEVSSIDFNTGIDTPGLTVRRTSTTIELKDGETFAIAGLFQQEYANNASQIPGLGDVPILGALFKSSRWRRKETELVVLVTPRLVTPSGSMTVSPDPLRVSNEPSAIDLILSGLNLDQPFAAPVGGLRGPLP
jgi:pilus assembly protein CpaC